MATTQLPEPASRIEATYRNLSTAELYEHAVRNGEATISAHGSLVVRTGAHTGRSPKDKFLVREPSSEGKIWWGEVNRPISEQHYDRVRARLMTYIADRPVYGQDLYIGTHPHHRRSLRVTTETAWASIFARNLFRRPPLADLKGFAPNFSIINVPSFKADPTTEGVRSETAILLHLKRMEIIIVGTEYAGEIKKSAFTVMNYLLPDEGALPMHSSVNVGRNQDPALFFGLSGTGKTTLSADPERSLISGMPTQVSQSPIGTDATSARRRRADRSAEYRVEEPRLAPFERVARMVIGRRIELAITQEELAERMGTSSSTISRIESGQHVTSVRTLERLADALEVKLLVGFETEAGDRELVAV